MQINILETEIEILKEQIGKQTQDDKLGSVSSQLSKLRNKIESLKENKNIVNEIFMFKARISFR